MALLTLSEYKSLLGVQAGDTRDDAQVTALLGVASKAVETFTGRDFDATTNIPTTRTFMYEGDQVLDIDDCFDITAVDVQSPNVTTRVLTADEWTAMPSGGQVFYYIVLHGVGPMYGISPEMGFERNLDQYPMLAYKPTFIGVTATWGWPAVPDDVKLATALTIRSFLTSAGGGAREGGLTAEAIAGFSRSWGSGAGTLMAALAIPNRARDLLVAYQRVFV